MEVYGFINEKELKKQRQKARELKKTPWWRQQLAKRTCHYCEKQFEMNELTMDHKTPLSRGGRSNKGNVVPACQPCNATKKHYTPAEMILQATE